MNFSGPAFTLRPVPEKYFKKILTSKVYDVARETPLDLAANLSKRLGNSVYLKREDLQPVFSFKIRGAYNKMAHVPAMQLKKGVVASSAGNHAQGVALAARCRNCPATIVMPSTTPAIKIQAVKALGAKVILWGDSYDEAQGHALRLARQRRLCFVHPYDDSLVIAGQGTVGMEIVRQHSSIDVIFVPVGGGGLIAGIAAFVKFLRPQVKIIGVEPDDADALFQSLKLGKRVRLKQVGGFADGVAVKQVGRETFALCQKLVDDVILVSTDAICAAIKDVFEDTRTMLEPAGALSIAGLTAYVRSHSLHDQNLVAVASGANMNFHRLRHVSERAELGEQREAIVAATIPERPGSFRLLLKTLGHCRLTEFNYRRGDPDRANVFMGLEIQDRDEIVGLLNRLKTHDIPAIDLTDNEVAKLHVRHMVGGKSPQCVDEILYRFEFPERPGALVDFLQALSPHWNISLFHYRNHGTDYGRVLVGLEASKKSRREFQRSLTRLNYKYWDETDNKACTLFLR